MLAAFSNNVKQLIASEKILKFLLIVKFRFFYFIESGIV
jgi:hypothetical protein